MKALRGSYFLLPLKVFFPFHSYSLLSSSHISSLPPLLLNAVSSVNLLTYSLLFSLPPAHLSSPHLPLTLLSSSSLVFSFLYTPPNNSPIVRCHCWSLHDFMSRNTEQD